MCLKMKMRIEQFLMADSKNNRVLSKSNFIGLDELFLASCNQSWKLTCQAQYGKTH